MAHNNPITYEQVKADYDMKDILERYIGPSRTNNKAGGWSCPFHSSRGEAGTPSLKLTRQNRAKCYGCGWTGDVIDFVKKIDNLDTDAQVFQTLGYSLETGLTPEQLEQKRREFAQEREARKAKALADEAVRLQTVSDKIAGMENRVMAYHNRMLITPSAFMYWQSQGLSTDTIMRYQLGYEPAFWIAPETHSPSFVIPTRQQNRLVSIRHRLQNPDVSGKYRPEFAGLPPQIFNVDQLHKQSRLPEKTALLVEGEIKAMFLDQLCYRVAGLPGLNTWQENWLVFFEHLTEIIICFDPDVDHDLLKREARMNVAKSFIGAGHNVKIVTLPTKPDDFFVKHGGKTWEFETFLRLGKVVK